MNTLYMHTTHTNTYIYAQSKHIDPTSLTHTKQKITNSNHTSRSYTYSKHPLHINENTQISNFTNQTFKSYIIHNTYSKHSLHITREHK